MPVPTNKQELYNAILHSFEKIWDDIKDISETESRLIGIPGHLSGTQISIRDEISYLLGWGELVLKRYTKKKKNEKVDIPETGYKWNELGKLAEKFYGDYNNDNFNLLRNNFRETVSEILKLIDQLDNQELYQELWYGKWTLGRMIQFNTVSPYKSVRTKIRKQKKIFS